MTFKDPNALDMSCDGHTDTEREKMKAFAERFLRWGEYISIEFDTKTGTATVISPD